MIFLARLAFARIIALVATVMYILQAWLIYDDRQEYVSKSVRSSHPRIKDLLKILTAWTHAFFNRIGEYIMKMSTRKKPHKSRPSQGTRHYYVRAHGRSQALHRKKRASYVAIKNGVSRQENTNAYAHYCRRATYLRRLYYSQSNIIPWLNLHAHTRKVGLLLPWDSDSQLIGVDTMSTSSMTHDKSDFIGATKKVKQTIRGLKGTTKVTEMGKV
jgi:hypothetical protein